MIRFTFFTAFPLSCCLAIAQPPVPAPTQPASAASTPGGVTTTQSADLIQFQKIEDNWSNAVNQHDQFGLENVLSPLFVDVAANGDISTRNQQIVQVISGDDKTIWLTQKVITVRMLGDIAVANGTYTLHHKLNSSPVDEKGVFTHVFERLHDRWICVNSQRTAVKEESPNSRQKNKSTASEPFHFPLFSRGDKNAQQ
jgi:ketosteroid isomerase-like protein